VILVDTGPLVALFDPADGSHRRCVDVLEAIAEPIATTIPVLTEAFHLLAPASQGSHRLMDFIVDGGLAVWSMDHADLGRAFELMVEYADQPMDLADASIVVAAERNDIGKVFTVDRKDFAAYRIKRGHRRLSFEVLG
jgi:predicted nucleic acid-binding protein